MAAKKGKKERVEVPDFVEPMACAIAVANGHSHPDHYAASVVAAFAGDDLPPHPTDTVDEPAEAEGADESTEA